MITRLGAIAIVSEVLLAGCSSPVAVPCTDGGGCADPSQVCVYGPQGETTECVALCAASPPLCPDGYQCQDVCMPVGPCARNTLFGCVPR